MYQTFYFVIYKAKIQRDLNALNDKLSIINETLTIKTRARNEYDINIHQTEIEEINRQILEENDERV